MIKQLQETPIKFKANQVIPKSITKLTPAFHHILEKISVLLIPLPLLMLFTGIEGIIEQESPNNLASLGSVSSGFFNFFDMHSLIIAGAFGVTFIIWFVTRNIWTNIEEDEDEEPENITLEYLDDEYKECADEELGIHPHSLN